MFVCLFVCFQSLDSDLDITLVKQLELCESRLTYRWLGVLCGYKGLLLLFGAFLAWETRNVSIPALNDSKYAVHQEVKIFGFFATALSRSGQTSSNFPWRLIEFFQKTYILHTSVYYVKQRKNFLIVLWTSKSVSLEGRSALWTERQPSRIRQPLCQSELSFNSHERPRQNFSVEYQYIIKHKSDENKVKYHQGS